jgi:hypothetical protein
MTLVALWSAAAPLLLDAVCRSDFARVRQIAATTHRPLVELEREHFGLTATQACAQLLRLWGLSPVLAGWVAHSGDAAALPASGLSADVVAHMAGAIVDALDGQPVPGATLASIERLGLGSRLAAWSALAAEAVERAA